MHDIIMPELATIVDIQSLAIKKRLMVPIEDASVWQEWLRSQMIGYTI